MKRGGGQLTLVVPGLFGPAAAAQGPGSPDLTSLLKLLARGRRFPAPQGLERLLFELFEVPIPPDQDLPVAPLTYAADTGRLNPDWLMRADPVHLRPDQQHLLLMAGSVLGVREDEARAIADGFQAQFADTGWQLEVPVPARWYLRLPDAPRVQTTPLAEVMGRAIDGFLPRGTDAAAWHRLLNELQMWLYQHPVNEARSERGMPTLNSVWLWGAGRLPEGVRSNWDLVVAQEPLAVGLTMLAGGNIDDAVSAETVLQGLERGWSVLAVVDDAQEASHYADPTVWQEAASALERRWFQPLYRGLADGRVRELRLYPASVGKGYRVGRGKWQALWRRVRPLSAYWSSDGG